MGGASRDRGGEGPDAHRRARLLDALREMATALLAHPPEDGGFTLVARCGRELADARVAAVMVPDVRAGTASVQAVAGRVGSGLVGGQVSFPEPASVDAAAFAGDPPPVGAAAAGFYRDDLLPVPDVDGWMVVPLVADGRQLAVLALGRSGARAPYDQRDLAELGEFAAGAAEILDHAEARVRAYERAITEDQDRIATTLNDRVIQRILSAGLRLHAAQSVAADPVVADRIDDALRELDGAVQEIRATVYARVVGDATAVDR